MLCKMGECKEEIDATEKDYTKLKLVHLPIGTACPLFACYKSWRRLSPTVDSSKCGIMQYSTVSMVLYGYLKSQIQQFEWSSDFE